MPLTDVGAMQDNWHRVQIMMASSYFSDRMAHADRQVAGGQSVGEGGMTKAERERTRRRKHVSNISSLVKFARPGRFGSRSSRASCGNGLAQIC